MMCIKIGLVTICLYFRFALICGQATTTEIVFNQNPQVIGSSVVASSNATYTSNSDTFINWSYNGTTVSGVQIKNNQALTLFNNDPTGKKSLSASTTDPITNGDTFSMYFSVSSLVSNESGIEIKLTCTGCSVVTRSKNLMVTGCQPDTGSGVLSTLSSTPCGYGCQVRYSCKEGFVGEDVTATCLENAVFNASAICESITCPNTTLPCSNPRYCFKQTGSTNAGGNVTIQCNTGYNGSVSATCGNDGNWTITPQSPCPALCPVSSITSTEGRCTTATGEILEGQSITVTCCDSYNGNSTMAICTSDRSWSNLPTCTKPGSTKTAAPLSDGAIAGIVIGCLIVVALIIVVLIAIFCAEICCCTFSILCLSWGTKN